MGYRDVQNVLLGIIYLNIILCNSVIRNLVYSVENSDSVGNVDDIIAAVQLLDSVDLLTLFILATGNRLCSHVLIACNNGEFTLGAFNAR